ncbi:MAG: nucleotide exchange factor GrpE [Rhodothermia bacterium]|nr:nucleotide exchange factor GrpE [Rhodothermia bacterium]
MDAASAAAADGGSQRATRGGGVDQSGVSEGASANAASDEEVSTDEELRTLRDRLLRQAAEFQNFRRRVEQERKQDVKFGQSIVLQELLDVFDDLRRSVEAATDAGEEAEDQDSARHESLREGVDLVYRKFSEVLQRFGVEPIEAVGTPFDEQEHEAMMQQPAPEGTEPGTVLAEVQKGYRMGERVLRHSKVVVASDDPN